MRDDSSTASSQIPATDQPDDTPEAQEARYAGANPETDSAAMWEALEPPEQLAEIFAHFTDPQRWIEMELLEVFAQFYHAKPMWGMIKAKAKEIGASPYDIEEAVKQIVRQQARHKVLEALQQSDPTVKIEDIVANFTEFEWLEDATLQLLARYYDDAPTLLRVKAFAKKAGVSPFDLDKAIRQIHARQNALKPPSVNGALSASHPVFAPATGPVDWREQLITNQRGEPSQNTTNIGLILTYHDAWKGRFWWDEVRQKPMIGDQPLSDKFVTDFSQWLGMHERMSCSQLRLIERCIVAECQNTRVDLLQEWLKSLPPWDKVHRLNDWLGWVCQGVTPSPYAQDVSRLLILGPTVRALHPGCQYRFVVILHGPQDVGKSELVRAIAGEKWYGSLTHDLANKEALMLLQGSWVCELEELDSFRGTALTRLKAFVTSRNDVWVPKFSNNRTEAKRRTVFIGSTNEDEIFQDQTGETRYLPISIGAVNLDHFLSMRDQLFAEALQFYDHHQRDWWQLSIDGALEAETQREERRKASIYEETLRTWLEDTIVDAVTNGVAKDDALKQGVLIQDVLAKGLKIGDPERWKDRALQMQAAQAMRALGWKVSVVKIRDIATGKWQSQRVWKPA